MFGCRAFWMSLYVDGKTRAQVTYNVPSISFTTVADRYKIATKWSFTFWSL